MFQKVSSDVTEATDSPRVLTSGGSTLTFFLSDR